MDPPPSLACATGTIPLATAAAEPPDEPPVEWPVFQGLRAGGKLRPSVVTVVPSSGTLVRPRWMKPAARSCSARYDVTGQARSRSGPSPNVVGSPAPVQPKAFNNIRTPGNGRLGGAPSASVPAWSNPVRRP